MEEIRPLSRQREGRVLQLRFRVEGWQEYTLEEVGKKFGVTRGTHPPNRGKGITQTSSPQPPVAKLRDYLR